MSEARPPAEIKAAATILMLRGDKLTAGEKPAGNLIPFPQQLLHREPEQTRSREHGVVGP